MTDVGLLTEALVILGPTDTIAGQIEYGTRTWGDAFVVAVVTPRGEPECYTKDDRTFCTRPVIPRTLLKPGQLEKDTAPPDHAFRLYYWFATAEPFEIDADTEYLAFLAPTHAADVYAPTAVLVASPDALAVTRASL